MSDPFSDNRFPIASEDNDWWAFPRTWTKREVVSEMIYNHMDWWLDENTWLDDDDKVHGWFGAIRSMFNAVKEGRLRHAREDEYGHEDDYWYEDVGGEIEAWIVDLN